MIAEVLSAAIIQFCALNSTQDLKNDVKSACMDFMVNCAIDSDAKMSESSTAKCERIWRHDTEAQFKRIQTLQAD